MMIPHVNRLLLYGLSVVFLSHCTGMPMLPDQGPVQPTATLVSTDQAGRPLVFGAFRYQEQIYTPLIAKYNQDVGTPVVKLLIFEDLPDYPQQFTAGFSLAHFVAAHADVSTLIFSDQEELQAGDLYNLTPLVDADATFDRTDFPRQVLDTTTVAGKLYMIPHTVKEQPLYYNQALWKQQNIPLPPPDWSWDDYLSVLRSLPGKLSTGEETSGYSYYGNPDQTMLGALSASAMLRQAAHNGTLQLTSPEVASLFAHIVDLAQSRAMVMPNTAAFGGPPDRIALWNAAGENRTGFASARPPVQIGTLSSPRNPAFNRSLNGYVISAVTPDPAAAWQLLAFLSRQTIPYNSEFLDMPARMSVAEKIQFWQHLDPETTAALRTMLERPYQPISPQLRRAAGQLSVALQQVVNGADQTTALQAAQTAYDVDLAALQTPQEPLPLTLAVPTDAPHAAITISYANIIGDLGLVQSVARDFQHAHPDIAVNLLSDIPSRQLSDLATSFDCFPSFEPPMPSDESLLADLKPYIEADQQFDLKTYDPLALSVLTHDGKLTGLPLEVSYRFLVFNLDRARQFGVADLVDSITSYEQLTALLSALPPANPQEQWYPVVSNDVVADALMLLEVQGIATLDRSSGTAQPQVNSPAVVNATRAIAALLANGDGAIRSDRTEPETTATQRFLDGNALILLTDQWAPLRNTTIPVRVVVVTTQPAPVNAISTTSIHIAANSAHADACWQWIRFLTTHVSSMTLAFPAHRSAVGELDAPLQQVWQAYHPRGATLALNAASLRHGRESQGFADALLKIMQGQDARTALNEAQTQTEGYFNCVAEGRSSVECQTAFP